MSVINGSKDNFEKEVLKSEKKVLVDFNATWCGPCKMMGPIIEELSEEMKDIKFVSVDVDDEDELAETYGVSSIPCLVLFEDGKEVSRNVGFMPKDELENVLGGK